MHQVLFVFCIALLTVSAEPGLNECPDSGLKYDMIETIMTATFVVYGQDIAHDDDIKDVNFEVYCVIKTGGMNIPSNITIKQAVPEDECSPTQMEVGKKYIVILKRISPADLSRDRFKLHEIHDGSAAFDATSKNLTNAANACNMPENQRLIVPDDHDPEKADCPTRTVTDDTCLSFGVSSSCKILSSALVYVYAMFVMMRIFL